MLNQTQTDEDFDGSDYSRNKDHARLKGQILDVYDCLNNSQWWTLAQIESATGHP